MWYVIQTITGKEQELVDAVGRVPGGKGKKYECCFVIYREFVWRFGGKWKLQIEPLFPSYVFVETDMPEEFFLTLKQVPRLSNLLGKDADGGFWGIYGEEEEFLSHMISRDDEEGERQEAAGTYLVRRSLVRVDEEGRIISAEGVLGHYMDRIVKQRLRKRSVVIEIPFLGKKRRVQLGIRVEGDEAE